MLEQGRREIEEELLKILQFDFLNKVQETLLSMSIEQLTQDQLDVVDLSLQNLYQHAHSAQNLLDKDYSALSTQQTNQKELIREQGTLIENLKEKIEEMSNLHLEKLYQRKSIKNLVDKFESNEVAQELLQTMLKQEMEILRVEQARQLLVTQLKSSHNKNKQNCSLIYSLLMSNLIKAECRSERQDTQRTD